MHPALIGTLRRLFHYALGGMGSGEIVNRDLAPSMEFSTGIVPVLNMYFDVVHRGVVDMEPD